MKKIAVILTVLAIVIFAIQLLPGRPSLALTNTAEYILLAGCIINAFATKYYLFPPNNAFTRKELLLAVAITVVNFGTTGILWHFMWDSYRQASPVTGMFCTADYLLITGIIWFAYDQYKRRNELKKIAWKIAVDMQEFANADPNRRIRFMGTDYSASRIELEMQEGSTLGLRLVKKYKQAERQVLKSLLRDLVDGTPVDHDEIHLMIENVRARNTDGRNLVYERMARNGSKPVLSVL